LREAKSATGRNNSVVKGCAGRSTSLVDEVTSEVSDAEGYFWPFAPDRRWMPGDRWCLSASGKADIEILRNVRCTQRTFTDRMLWNKDVYLAIRIKGPPAVTAGPVALPPSQ
jgi:hypothetical protein